VWGDIVSAVEKESCTWKLRDCFEISRKEMGPSELFPFSFPLGACFVPQVKRFYCMILAQYVLPIAVGGGGSRLVSRVEVRRWRNHA